MRTGPWFHFISLTALRLDLGFVVSLTSTRPEMEAWCIRPIVFTWTDKQQIQTQVMQHDDCAEKRFSTIHLRALQAVCIVDDMWNVLKQYQDKSRCWERIGMHL